MKKIPLYGKYGKGKFALVDDDDYEYLMLKRWTVSKEGYVISHHIKMHRVVTNALKGQYVDHKFHNKLDNRKHKLRVCSQSQNLGNQRKQLNRTSTYKGVSLATGREGREKCWLASTKLKGKTINLGYYATEKEAGLAYNKKALELHGEFALLNVI